MYDIKIHENGDGEPVLTLTLTAPEVSDISSALTARHREYRYRVIADGSIARDAVAHGVARSAHQLGQWCALEDALSSVWWPYINGLHDDDDCDCGCTDEADDTDGDGAE